MTFYLTIHCKNMQVEESLVKQIYEKIKPILETTEQSNDFNTGIVKYMIQSQQTILKNFKTWELLLFTKIKKQLEITKREISLLFLIDYATIVDGVYTHIVDMICFALICGGKTLPDTRRGNTKMVGTLDEINELPLGAKLDFLKQHDLIIISDVCKVRIRNSAAHLTYRIEEDGSIFIPGITDKLDLSTLHTKIRDISLAAHLALKLFYSKYEKLYSEMQNMKTSE